MKKNINFISLHPSLCSWLMSKLKTAPADIADKNEFLEALQDLADGSSTSLMVEINNDVDSDTVNRQHRFTDKIQCGNLSIDVKSRKVIRDGKEISLTPKEFDILYFLADNRGEVFTKEQIYKAVWEGDYLLDDSNIMAFIRKIRKKIEPNPDAPEYIQTIWGIGYKFNDEISKI